MNLDVQKLKIEVCKHGMNQKELVEKSGVSKATISKIYNGGSCSTETAKKIVSVLGLELRNMVKE
ncbi:helix-turn-helix transcriptional regulator [Holdemanella biformis]|jgi:transcriptional regulator with XRE-family HTH domain|uniref:helix-turn-helix transcriptional regulator n=1 Tax=Holdemanella biformis TaxID=1735 RepID=UPI003A9322FA